MKKIWKLIKSIRSPYVNIKYFSKLVFICKEIFKANDIQVTGTGVLQLFLNDYIIKVPFGELSTMNLEQEYKNYLKLKRSSLLKYVDYKLEKIKNYYIIEKLYSIQEIDIDNIISDLENGKLKKDKDIVLSLNLLNKWCNKNFKFNFQYEKSVMHGDLTPKNIMANKKGHLVLIDLDRFTFNGIKGLDKLHFIIEKESKENNIDFFDWMELNFNKYDKKLLFLYFVYRINIEHFEKVKLPDFYYKKSCKLYDKFIRGI